MAWIGARGKIGGVSESDETDRAAGLPNNFRKSRRFLFYRLEGEVAHFQMLTFWDDSDAIKRFAGEDYEIAKYYDFDRSFLVELELKVLHYTVYDE